MSEHSRNHITGFLRMVGMPESMVSQVDQAVQQVEIVTGGKLGDDLDVMVSQLKEQAGVMAEQAAPFLDQLGFTRKPRTVVPPDGVYDEAFLKLMKATEAEGNEPVFTLTGPVKNLIVSISTNPDKSRSLSISYDLPKD